jgi:hypothetical protein
VDELVCKQQLAIEQCKREKEYDLWEVWGREPRGIQFLSLLFGSADSASSGTPIRLHSFGSPAARTGNEPAAELLFSAKLPDAATDGATCCSSESLCAMQLNQRGQRYSAAMGDPCRGDRSSVYVFALAAVFVGKGPEQVSELRTGV